MSKKQLKNSSKIKFSSQARLLVTLPSSVEICPVEIAAELQLECDMFDDISMSKLTVMVTGSDHADLAVDIPYVFDLFSDYMSTPTSFQK